MNRVVMGQAATWIQGPLESNRTSALLFKRPGDIGTKVERPPNYPDESVSWTRATMVRIRPGHQGRQEPRPIGSVGSLLLLGC